MRRSCKWRTRWASAICSETEGDGAPGGGRGPQGLERQEAVIHGVLTVRPRIAFREPLHHHGRRPSRRSRNGIERSPRREGKAAMEQAGRRTQVRAALGVCPVPGDRSRNRGTAR